MLSEVDNCSAVKHTLCGSAVQAGATQMHAVFRDACAVLMVFRTQNLPNIVSFGHAARAVELLHSVPVCRGQREFYDMRQDQLARRWPELAAQYRTEGSRAQPINVRSGARGHPDHSLHTQFDRRRELDALADPLFSGRRQRMGTQPDVPLQQDNLQERKEL